MSVERRSATTREKTKNKVAWKPPAAIDTPEAPDGFKFRWLRRTRPGEQDDDVQNLLSREKQGYQIVTAEMLRNYGGNPEAYQTLESGKHQGAVITGDLVLTIVDEEIVDARTEYFENQSRMQLEAVKQQLRQNQNPLMPISDESRSRTKVGSNSFDP